jgi:hypothetical protein
VIDIAHKALNTSQTISYDSNSGVGFANSGSISTHPATTIQNSLQYQTLQPPQQQIDSSFS